MSVGPEPSRAGTSSTARSLFISYRRDDTAGWAGRLQADLRSRLGPGVQVFMDIDGIPAGEDFARAIDSAVGRCDALVALIGPDWIDANDPDGRRRLEDPKDFVRIEIEAALRRDIRVIPALVGDASLPRRDELPEPLSGLIRRQAVKLNNETWDLGVSRLVKAIEPTSGNGAPPRLRLSTHRVGPLAGILVLGVIAALILVVVLLLRPQPSSRTSEVTPSSAASRSSGTGSTGASGNPYGTGRDCGDGVYAGPNTSCPFAFNVRQAWQQAPGMTKSVTVYSPTTALTYQMSCAPAGSAISCSGGHNASVTFRY